MDNNNSLLKNRKKRLLILAGIILIVVVLPLTIYLVKQQQEQRGRAAEPDKLEAEGGTLSADGVIIQSDTLASGGKHIVFVDVTPSPDLTPSPTPPSGQVSAFIESGGSVVMETENNDGKFNRNGYRWDGAAPDTPNTATTGFVGDGFIAARPNDDLKTFFAASYNQGPEVVYNVNFTTTGTYFVYLRSSGPDAKSDSAHVGLDGALNGSMALYFIGEGGATSNWKWRSNNNDGTRTKINVSTPGIHTFHIFMREDGTRIDRIRLSTNKDWVANPNDSAKGPDESPRGTF